MTVRRGGFTLLELMLVLALIVLVAAASWPSFEAWFQGYKISEAVDQVQTHWLKGRILAMEEGRPYRFAYENGGSQYRLAPDDFEHWPELVGLSWGPRASGASYPAGTLLEEALPEGVVFGMPTLGQTAGGWAEETIVFQFDGSARIYDAEGLERPDIILLLSDRQGRTKGLSLRALTGVVTAVNNLSQTRGP